MGDLIRSACEKEYGLVSSDESKTAVEHLGELNLPAPSIDQMISEIAAGTDEACRSAEVLQEILHRYRLINRWKQGREVYSLAKKIVPRILPVDVTIIEQAYGLMDKYSAIYTRDAVHAATCFSNGISEINERKLKIPKPSQLEWMMIVLVPVSHITAYKCRMSSAE